MNEERLVAETPEGRIIAYKSDDPDYPGIYVSFQPKGEDYEFDLMLANVDLRVKNRIRVMLWEDEHNEKATRFSEVRTSEYVNVLNGRN